MAPSPWDSITPLEEDWTTAIGNMHTKCDKDHAQFGRYARGGQTHTQTDVLITVLRHCSHGWTNKLLKCVSSCACNFIEMVDPSQLELPVDQEVDDDDDSAIQSQVFLVINGNLCYVVV